MKLLLKPCLALLVIVFGISLNLFGQSFTPQWAFNIDGNDPAWPGYYNKQISDAGRLSDGFVICGTQYQAVFNSKDTNTFGRTNFGGAYVAKYDFNGKLKWIDYSVDSIYTSLTIKTTISAVATDGNDNIYICGRTPYHSRFYYNDGLYRTAISTYDTSASAPTTLGYFIAKLNKNGVPIWHTHLNSEPNLMECAKNGRLVVVGEHQYNQCLYMKGSDTTVSASLDYTTSDDYQFVYWIDTLDGTLKKWSTIREHSTNYQGITDISTDVQGNVVLAGNYEFWIKFMAHGRTDSLTISQPNTSAYGWKYFLMKYDTAGKPVWSTYLKSTSYPVGVRVTNNGTIYSVASISSVPAPNTAVLTNSDSTTVPISTSGYHLLSYTPKGKLRWLTHGGIDFPEGLNANDTFISVSGSNLFPTNSTSPRNDTLFGANKLNNFYLPHADPHLALAHYDSVGNVLHATRTGASNGKVMFEHMMMLPADSTSLLVMGDGSMWSGADSVMYYQDTLRFNGWDGFVIKTTPYLSDSVNMPPMPPKIFLNESKTDTLLCVGKTFIVFDSMVSTFNRDNSFGVLLSDATGSFNFPQLIGTFTGPQTDSIVCTIPTTVIPGNNYRIQIYTSSPQLPTGISRKLTIRASVVPTVSTTASPGLTITQGQLVTFSSTNINGGSSPKYQWLRNGIEISGATNSVYATDSLSNNDTIVLRMISDIVCPLPDTVFSMPLIAYVASSVGNFLVGPLKVYPNPSKGFLRITGNTPATNVSLELLNVLGQTVFSSAIKGLNGRIDTIITLSSVNAGIYVLKIKGDGFNQSIKLAIE